MKPIITILAMVCFLTGIPTSVFCQNPEETYQKALVKEEGEGKLQEAIDLFHKVAYNPKSENALQAKAKLHLGMCYEKLGMEQAREAYTDVIKNYPHQETEVAVARERVMKLDEHLVDINENVKKHIETGNELYSLWEYDEAIQEYQKAIELDPNSLLALNAKYYIGQSQFKNGQYEKALSTFTNLVEENPSSNIAPVSELMITQVKNAIKKNRSAISENPNEQNKIVDSETGITYKKIKSYAGKNDLISHTGGLNLSPDARFVVLENKVVPLDGSEPFDLVKKEDALRAVYAPGMNLAAFYSDSAIWTVPTSPITGKAISTPEKLLTGNYKYQHIVSWSPEGDRIAFSRRDKNTLDDIWTISLKGRSLTPIYQAKNVVNRPVWSPDGKYIAYDGDGYYLAPIDGGAHKRITTGGGYPYWSPDSKWIMFSGWGGHRLFSMESEQETNYKSPTVVGKFLGFSPEENGLLYFRSSFDDQWGIKVVSTKGGPSFKPALNNPVYDSYWLADSKYLIIQSDDENAESQFKMVALDGEKSVDIQVESEVKGDPVPFAFSSDFTQLVFSVKKDTGEEDLYIAPFSIKDARTSSKARLIFSEWSSGAYNVTFNWSKDGERIALVHNGDIWIVPLNGTKPKQITKTEENERWVRWSPDGEWISYLTPGKQSAILNIISADGKVKKMINDKCRTSYWSPDSKSFVLLASNQLNIVSLDGKELRHISSLKEQELTDTSAPQYSPDGQYLAFIGNKDDESMIYLYSLTEDNFKKLAFDVIDDYKYSLRWSPDGKWLSYLTYEQVKARPEGILWEADFEEVKEKLLSRD